MKPKWWNGIHAALKMRFLQRIESSNLSFGTVLKRARVVELAYTTDLKSVALWHEGSSPSSGTNRVVELAYTAGPFPNGMRVRVPPLAF